MGLPLSLPRVHESWAVLSVISSTATLSGGPGGPGSVRQWRSMKPHLIKLIRSSAPCYVSRPPCSLQSPASCLPCACGDFSHCVSCVQRYEVITERNGIIHEKRREHYKRGRKKSQCRRVERAAWDVRCSDVSISLLFTQLINHLNAP